MKENVNIKIHPAAEVFPMLPEDELQELAADIKENGLRESVKISNGFLIDGRNRLAACKIAGVEPRIEELNGTDPVAYILSANIKRRHMNKGQQAIAVAMIYPEPKSRGKIILPFSKTHLSQARKILKWLPESAKRILAGDPTVLFTETFEKAKLEEQAAEDSEKSLDSLRKIAPDLAARVDDGMKLSEALAAWEERKSEEVERIKNQRETMMRLGEQAYSSTVAWSVETFCKSVNESLADQEFRTAFLSRVRINPSNLGEIQKGARVFARLLTKLTK